MFAHISPKLLDSTADPLALADERRQPVGVVEGSGEPEEGEYSGEFVEDEEGGDVGDGSVPEGLDVSAKEVGETRFDARNAGCFFAGGR